MRRPNALYRAQTDTHGLGHRPSGPMGGGAQRLGAGRREHPRHGGLRQRRGPRAPGLVAQKSFYAGFGETALPSPYRRSADPSPPGDLGRGQPVRQIQHDARPLDVLARAIAVGDQRGKPRPLFAGDDHTEFLSHASACHSPALQYESSD